MNFDVCPFTLLQYSILDTQIFKEKAQLLGSILLIDDDISWPGKKVQVCYR